MAEASDGRVAASTVNWVTQGSFVPPLVVVGVKADSLTHSIIKQTAAFALNVLGKEQKSLAYTFFKSLQREDNTIGGEPFRTGENGSPIFSNTPAFVECKLVETVEKGDHCIFVGEVVNAGVSRQPEGRPDEATLWLLDLGENIFYGG